ncbi:hypothetical protein GCM10020254_87890 [Streptomyces goshikiensis]
MVPGGESVQELVSCGILDGCETLGEPAFVEQEPPVRAGQDVALHEQVAQVGGRSPVFLLLQALVAERDATGCQALQEVDYVGAAEPDQPAFRAVEFQEEVHERCQPRVDLAGAVVKEIGEPVGQGAAFAEPAAKQHSLEAATVAEEVSADPRTVTTDRGAVRIAAGQQPVGATAWAVAPDPHGLFRSRCGRSARRSTRPTSPPAGRSVSTCGRASVRIPPASLLSPPSA